MKLAQRLALQYIRTKFKLLSFFSEKKAAASALVLFRSPQSRDNKKPTAIFSRAERLEFKLDGVIIRGYRWNAGGERKAMIAHGFESAVSNFDEYITGLIEKKYEVLAFDAPGHGESGGTMISAPQYAEMILKIYKDYGPVQSYLAHSFGGLAVCLALERIPHDETYRVALVAPAAETTTAVEQFCKLVGLNEKTKKRFDTLIEDLGGNPAAWFSIRRTMHNIHARVLWFQDEDDQQTPLSDALKVRNENHPGLDFVITKGLGHSRIYRDAAVQKAILRFL
jgi:hypothetical protein